ncbi:MAG: SpoIIE family protein phosphatase [Desulfobacterales bacterium]|nr:SpoIIE family protein phosphatase [Desulfobacterales bacterium]
MKIRWKFFIILIAFSLTPLLALTFISRNSVEALGRSISDDTRRNLTENAHKALLMSAKNLAKSSRRSKNSFELALQVLANDVEQALADDPGERPRIYFARDFDDPASAPWDLATSPHYFKRAGDGQFQPQPISLGAPAFLIAPGAAGKNALDDIDRLAGLGPTLKNVFNKLWHSVHWAQVSLESGAYLSYPGHGSYPADFNPMKRQWYKAATDSPRWTLPIVDASSGLVTFTVSKRVNRPAGSFAGVVTLDLLMTKVISEKEFAALWSSEARTFSVGKTGGAEKGKTGLVSYLTSQGRTIPVGKAGRPGKGKAGLIIFGGKGYQERSAEGSAEKRGVMEFEWLTSPDTARFENFLNRLEEGASGVAELSYNGVESIWAYANIEKGWFFIIIVPKSVIRKMPDKQVRVVRKYTKDQLVVTFITVILVVICLAAAAFFSSRSITKKFVKISAAAEKLARGDFSVRLDIRTNDERDRVIEAFNEIGPKLEDNIRLQKSLDLAMEVQQNLLPRSDPQIEGLDIAGASVYCDSTGGDYYDYLVLGEGNEVKVGVVVGDVSDHGIPSALLMAAARSSLRQRSALPGGLDAIVSDLNNRLAEDVQASGRFMTLFFLSIDPKNRSLQWVRAGHDPAILYDPASDAFEKLLGAGIALGVDENRQYEVNEKTGLKKGQVIVLATDGVWEARNADGDMFGKEPIYKTIRENPHESAKSILDIILDSLARFQEDAVVEDDATLVVVKILDG